MHDAGSTTMEPELIFPRDQTEESDSADEDEDFLIDRETFYDLLMEQQEQM